MKHYDKPRESTSGPARPDSVPFEIENVSAEGTPDVRPKHQLRHRGGRFRRDGMGGIDVVSSRYFPNVRDHSILHSPVLRPQPMAADWSNQPTYAEITHARQCGGPGRCALPGLHAFDQGALD